MAAALIARPPITPPAIAPRLTLDDAPEVTGSVTGGLGEAPPVDVGLPDEDVGLDEVAEDEGGGVMQETSEPFATKKELDSKFVDRGGNVATSAYHPSVTLTALQGKTRNEGSKLTKTCWSRLRRFTALVPGGLNVPVLVVEGAGG
jgi:hypothetical protein